MIEEWELFKREYIDTELLRDKQFKDQSVKLESLEVHVNECILKNQFDKYKEENQRKSNEIDEAIK
jgi:hypothetical protein